jgi:hypothetical protein
MPRIVCQFSCGAASAVATKLILTEAAVTGQEVAIVNAFIKEEHPDNRRFLADCERWMGRTFTVLRDERDGASVIALFRRRGFMKSQHGAICSMTFKRALLDTFKRPDDTVVLGYTAEEADRLEDFRENFPHLFVRAPLVERGLTKADTLAIVERAGLVLPLLYRLGYNNANCIGCIKGGMGYFNKVRRDFPEEFEAVCKVEDEIGDGAKLFRDRKTGVRFSLRDLDPAAGRHDETVPSCSFFCELAEGDL